jgi:hypothetical protein
VQVIGDNGNNPADLEQLRIMMTNLRHEGSRVIGIFDLSLASPLTAKQRKYQAEWLADNAPLMRFSMAALAYVVPDPIVRGVLTALFWIARPPVRHVLSSTIDEALAWSLAQCDVAGIPVAEELRSLGVAALLGRQLGEKV